MTVTVPNSSVLLMLTVVPSAAEPNAVGLLMRVTPAPMGLGDDAPLTLLDWLPSLSGFEQTRLALHESLGLLVGA